MKTPLDQFIENEYFEWQGESFELSSQMICMLHHWNFGTSKEYYRSKNKALIVPNRYGRLCKIEDVQGALDAAFEAYNRMAEKKFASESQNELMQDLDC